MRFVAIITLAILALVGGQSRVWGKVCVGEKLASGVFAPKYDESALVDEAASLEFAGRDGRCGYELVSGQSKWLSRDPIGERGGINLYGMVRNDPVNKWDYLGLWNPIEGAVVEIIERLTNPGVIWSPAPCPGKDVETRFIQVFWYNTTPKATGGTVDNGSEGNWQSPPGFHVPTDPTQPWYPQENAGDPFTDNPKGLFNVYTTFEVCRACYCPSAKCAKSVGPCRKWRRYDSGDITYFPGSETPSAGWWEAVKRKWPNLICK
jgi:hypothetical protein